VRYARSIIGPRALRALVGGALAVALGVLAGGCGTSRPAPVTVSELAEAQTFPYYPVYWVGPRLRSYALAAVDGRKSYSASTGDGVYYGNCVPGKSSALNGHGCELPLRVITTLYQLHANVALGNPQRNVLLRGVPAIVYDGGDSIELYSGRLMIEVFSDGPAEALRAVSLLRPINAPGSAAGPLPAPVFCPTLSGSQPQALQNAMQHLPHAACQRAAANLRGDLALFGKP
jgi:hypothetical protein